MALASTLALGAAVIFIAIAVSTYNSSAKARKDGPEPPFAPGGLPIIGHLLGLIRYTLDDFVSIQKLVRTPIFTIHVPGQKMYVVTDPSYIPAIEKQHRVLAFAPIEAMGAAKVFATNEFTKKKILEEPMSDHGMAHGGREAILTALRPGSELDTMYDVTMEHLVTEIDAFQAETISGKEIGLWDWTRTMITSVTTDALFGPKNPFHDPAFSDAFWEFERGLLGMFISPFPSLTHRSASAARERCTDGLEPYIAGKHYLNGSQMIRGRVAVHTEYGVHNTRDLARFELGPCIAALSNTAQAAFWLILHVYRDPNLLAQVRREVENVTRVDEANPKKHIINVTALKQECPILSSTFQETLRYHIIGTSIRKVIEDTTLNGWALEKGALLQVPGRTIHLDEANYGASAAQFEPLRFHRNFEDKSGKVGRERDICFRSFGGGRTLCPGRHFATNEVLATVALFISRFDMEPARDAEWTLPTTKNARPPSFIEQPDHDIAVQVKLRDGRDNWQWALQVKSAEKILATTIEDKLGN